MADATKVQLKEIYPIPEAAKKKAWVSGREAYDKLWKRSVEEPEKFWAEIAEQQVTWFKKWDKVMDYNFDIKKGPIYVKFFEGGKLNVSYNCLDRHLEKRGNQVAIQWEGNEPGEAKGITYKMLHEEVCKFANVLKANGVKKGDRVVLYMPMVPELASQLWPAPASAPFIVSFSADSAPTRSETELSTVKLRYWLFATELSAAAKQFPRKQ
jgi:acetyl-CoA synthetase